MGKWFAILLLILPAGITAFGQVLPDNQNSILFHGLVLEASSRSPLPGTQILINHTFNSVSGKDGKFTFLVNRKDTVTFRILGYKSSQLVISDTLNGREFVAGIYMQYDTLLVNEVIIVPRIVNLKSDLLKPRTEADRPMENAKYNMAVSAYQGRVNQNKLGDPAINYELLRQRQTYDAYTKGQIPGDKMIGISPLLLIPAAYLLMNGFPERPRATEPSLTEQEINQIHKRYMETIRNKPPASTPLQR